MGKTINPMSQQKNILVGLACTVILIGGITYFVKSRPTNQQPNIQQNQAKTAETKKANNPTTKQDTIQPTDTKTPEAPKTTDAQETNHLDLPTIDDTWKTFSSKSGNYSFQWPTKGKYAPTWEQSFSDTNPCTCDERCNIGENKTLNGISFCHQSSIENPVTGGDYPHTGPTTLIDTYSTPHNNTFILITFKKNYKYDISEEAYYAHLDQIMSTFTFTK